MTEKQNIEYKREWHDDHLKWICGFANAEGGILFIGKNDFGEIVHLRAYKKLMDVIPQKIRNSMGLICGVNLQEEGKSKYIEIIVDPCTIPVSLRGRYYFRTGSTNVELTGVGLNEFLLRKANRTWDDVVDERASLDDIDVDSVAAFIEMSKTKGRMPDISGLSTMQLLAKLSLTDGDKLKRGAVVLFGKDPNQFYPSIQVKIGRFGKDSTDLRFHEIIEGNIIYMLNEALKQLDYKFLVRPIDFVGMHRIENREYPVDALREMLLNSMIHRTYMGAHVQMRVYDDRLSIWNEGALPMGLSVEDLRMEHISLPRNPKIARACFLAGYIDAWGRGTLKIISSCKDAGLPEPEISEKFGGVEVVVFKKRYPENIGNVDRVHEPPAGSGVETYMSQGDFGRTSEGLRKDFGRISERCRNVFGVAVARTFDCISNNPNFTAKQIAEETGKTSRTVENHIAKLKDAGIIRRVGAKLGGHWEIVV
ncbi:MAG: ATP-binding protein [Bacteroidales bacterium]